MNPCTFMLLFLLAAPAIAAPTANTGPPQSLIAFVDRERDHPCFFNISSASSGAGGGPDGAYLTDHICPGTPCAAKLENLTQVLINSGHNSYTLDGHLLLFQRDMACMRAPSSSDLCAKQLANVTFPPQFSRLFSFENWQTARFSLFKQTDYLDRDFISTSDDPSAVASNKSKYAVCDPSHCLNKYLLQWAAWLSRVPKQYLAQLPPDYNPADYSAERVVGAAEQFFGGLADKCNRNGTTGRINGTIADIKLEVDQSVPHKVVPSAAISVYSFPFSWLLMVSFVVLFIS